MTGCKLALSVSGADPRSGSVRFAIGVAPFYAFSPPPPLTPGVDFHLFKSSRVLLYAACVVDICLSFFSPTPTMNARNAKQSMAELKLRRVIEHNQRLKEDLARPRLRVSEAGASLIRYCKTTKDHLVPSVWGPVGKGEDPYAPPQQGCSCVLM
ncbi:unnamed protein product [Rhizoctonia solani]|uniref:Guanine nucleotide-binding protein subunit gamma n=2 Tax=Rhizoctonia solani TaxID=456999 RepID=A0A8H2X985_9AGAM|nr:unnamed protein product [Rhizoctonia solani]